MRKVYLKPKYEKIKNELINRHEDKMHTNSPMNGVIKQIALMVAYGLQLSEEYSEKENK